MKVTVKRILKDIETVIGDIEKEQQGSIKTNSKIYACNITRKQLLANAHIMVCNAFDEQSKFDE